MKIVSSLTIITVALLGLSAASSANATGSTSSGCSTTTSTCDTWQGATVYDMYDNGGTGANIDTGTSTTGSNVVVDGVGVEVSAWSDTGDYNGYYDLGDGSGSQYYGLTHDNNTTYVEDDTVQAAALAGPWTSNGETGYGIENADGQYDGQYSDGNGGTFNVNGDAHSIDNFSGSGTNYSGTTDYDMVLFSFSEEVALQGASFSWLTNSASTQQVSVVGLNDISGLTSGTSSWSDLAGSAAFVTSGSFQIAQTDSVYVSDFSISQTAQYWLVGAYNTVFGSNSAFSENDDGFKLATVGFTKKPGTPGEKPPTDVNAPNSFALLLLGGFVAWRKRKTK